MANETTRQVTLAVEQLVNTIAQIASLRSSLESRMNTISEHASLTFKALSALLSQDYSQPLMSEQDRNYLLRLTLGSVRNAVARGGVDMHITDRSNRRYKISIALVKEILMLYQEGRLNYFAELAVDSGMGLAVKTRHVEFTTRPSSDAAKLASSIRGAVSIHPFATIDYELMSV